MLLGMVNAPTLVTMVGLLSALVACQLALRGQPELALVGLIGAGLCDLFDGWVARRSQLDARARRFGVQIDSLVDMVSFGLTPVLIAFAFGLDGPLGLAVGAVYVCAAAQRLAYFNVLVRDDDGPVRTYTGLPVTFAALIFPLLLAPATLLPRPQLHWLLALMLLAVGALFVAPLRIRKPAGLVYVAMPLLAVVLSVYWIQLARQSGLPHG